MNCATPTTKRDNNRESIGNYTRFPVNSGTIGGGDGRRNRRTRRYTRRLRKVTTKFFSTYGRKASGAATRYNAML